jgi:hypothetical protein
VAEHCRELRELDLSWCTGVGDAGVIAVGEHCRELRELDLSGCKGVGDAGVIAVAEHCRELRELDLSWCQGVTRLPLCMADLHQLSMLNVIGCPLVVPPPEVFQGAGRSRGMRTREAVEPVLNFLRDLSEGAV